MALLPAAALTAWCASALPDALRLRRALLDPERAQARVLQEIVAANRDSTFGREHKLDRVRSPEEFLRQVPPRDHAGHAPYIERIAAGEAGVLTGPGPLDRVERLEPTSGSSGAAKLLPSTPRLRQQFNRAIGPWILDLYARRPHLLGGPAWWSVTPALPSRTSEGGLPIGFADDAEYLSPLAQALAPHTLAVPSSLARLTNVSLFYLACRVSLLGAAGLRLVSVWNPSLLGLVLGGLSHQWSELIQAVATGLELGPVRVPPRPARARALEALDRPDPARIWPHMRLLSCWTDAQAALDLPQAAAIFPQAEVQPKGLLATEAVVTIPLGGARPFAVLSHYYELLTPEGALQVHQLRPGQEGTLLVTTAGGLYRYHLRDRVRVVPGLGRTPGLCFLGREDRVSDRRGEKLSEAFVGEVLRALVPGATFALLAPEERDPPGYVLYVAGAAPDPEALDARLRENPHYDWCRRLGQLAQARVARVAPDSPQRALEAQRQAGQRLGDIKPNSLSPRADWGIVLDVLEVR